MRVLLISDESFTMRERAMLRRVEIGLGDEGVRVGRAAPVGLLPLIHNPFSETVGYEAPGPLLSDRVRARRVLERFEEARVGDRGAPVDIVHAWGDRCWSLAAQVAFEAGARLALEVWSHRLIGGLRRFERHAPPLVWMAPCEKTLRAIERARPASPAWLAPWGVHAPQTPTRDDADGRAPSVALVSSGRHEVGALLALDGVARAAARRPDLMVFLDAAPADEHERVRRRLRALHLLERTSIIPDVEGRRDLILRVDALLYPDAEHEHRSIVLDAMASGMAVVASQDDALSTIEDGRTARLADDAAGWERAILAALDDAASGGGVVASARRYVQQHRAVSTHLARIQGAYEALMQRSVEAPA